MLAGRGKLGFWKVEGTSGPRGLTCIIILPLLLDLPIHSLRPFAFFFGEKERRNFVQSPVEKIKLWEQGKGTSRGCLVPKNKKF